MSIDRMSPRPSLYGPGDAVHDHRVGRRADRAREAVVALERRLGAVRADELLGGVVELGGRDARARLAARAACGSGPGSCPPRPSCRAPPGDFLMITRPRIRREAADGRRRRRRGLPAEPAPRLRPQGVVQETCAIRPESHRPPRDRYVVRVSVASRGTSGRLLGRHPLRPADRPAARERQPVVDVAVDRRRLPLFTSTTTIRTGVPGSSRMGPRARWSRRRRSGRTPGRTARASSRGPPRSSDRRADADDRGTPHAWTVWPEPWTSGTRELERPPRQRSPYQSDAAARTTASISAAWPTEACPRWSSRARCRATSAPGSGRCQAASTLRAPRRCCLRTRATPAFRRV